MIGIRRQPPAAATSPGPSVGATIACLEASLYALPAGDDFLPVRAMLKDQIESQKKSAMRGKSLGSQVDGAKAALVRAEARLQAAENSVKTAIAAKKIVVDEVTAIKLELKNLEHQLSATNASHAGQSAESHIIQAKSSLTVFLRV